MDNRGPISWYLSIPVVSRVYLTLCVGTTALVALDVVSPLMLYYNYNLIFEKAQVWRIFTTFLFFGQFSLDFVFHMYFSIRYCRLLEENSFSNRTLDFIFLLGYGMTAILMIAPFNFINLPFLGQSLTFMLVYIWGRRNPQVRMSLMGLFSFTANYLPYVLLVFSIALGNSVAVDVIGMLIGHIYFFFDDIYPEVARLRHWKQVHYLRAPQWIKDFVHRITSNEIAVDAYEDLFQDVQEDEHDVHIGLVDDPNDEGLNEESEEESLQDT